MVKRRRTTVDDVFRALAHPTRREILAALGAGDQTVSEVAARFSESLPAISRHIAILERAGAIGRTRDGRAWRLHLRPSGLDEAARWLASQADHPGVALDALGEHLARARR